MSTILLYINILVLLSVSILSCKENTERISLLDENGKQNGQRLEEIISSKNINNIVLTRPLGYSFDTTYYNLEKIETLYGERLFTLGNEKFQSRDVDSIAYIGNDTLKLTYKISGYDYSGPFTQEYVSSYWETGNGYLLNKKLPSFKGYSYSGNYIDLDSMIAVNDKTIIHFGWLNCLSCMKEQAEIVELEEQNSGYTFVNVTIDTKNKLAKYLEEKGQMYELKPPYSNVCKKMIKPILYDEENNIFDKFHLEGMFPVNFLVDNSGTVKKIGGLSELIDEDVEIIRVW